MESGDWERVVEKLRAEDPGIADKLLLGRKSRRMVEYAQEVYEADGDYEHTGGDSEESSDEWWFDLFDRLASQSGAYMTELDRLFAGDFIRPGGQEIEALRDAIFAINPDLLQSI